MFLVYLKGFLKTSFCLFDLAEQILHFTSLRHDDTLKFCLSVKSRPGPLWWSSANAFNADKWTRGRPSDNINTGISFALMLCKLPWFFFPQPLSNPHWSCDTSRSTYKAYISTTFRGLQGSSIIHAERRWADWIVTSRAATDGENERGMSCSPFMSIQSRNRKSRISKRDLNASRVQVHSQIVANLQLTHTHS